MHISTSLKKHAERTNVERYLVRDNTAGPEPARRRDAVPLPPPPLLGVGVHVDVQFHQLTYHRQSHSWEEQQIQREGGRVKGGNRVKVLVSIERWAVYGWIFILQVCVF